MAGKYARIFWTEVAHLREYKLEFFGEYLRIPIQIGLLYALWSIVFAISGKTLIGGLEFEGFVFYIGMAAFVSSALPAWEVSEKISDFITRGKIIMILVRPVHFIPFFFAREAADFVTRGLLAVAVFGLTGALLGWFIPSHAWTIPLFVVSLVLGLSLQYLVTLCVGMMAFFMYTTWGVRGLMNTLKGFFSGELIPLTLFPAGLGFVASVLPFKYVLFVPLFVYLEQYSYGESLRMLALQCLYIIVALFASLFLSLIHI